jgi:hypothetical protein
MWDPSGRACIAVALKESGYSNRTFSTLECKNFWKAMSDD